MFASKVAKTPAPATVDSINKTPHQRTLFGMRPFGGTRKNSSDREQEHVPESRAARAGVHWDFSKLPTFPRDRTLGSQAKTLRGGAGASSVDRLGTEEAESSSPYVDQAAIGDAGAIAGAPPAAVPPGGATPAAPSPAAPAPAGPATPNNLRQIRTSWTPAANQYGFQLKFQCGSSSGSVADLQAQAPKLIWREYVTYSRNDFSHRFKPVDPTILPTGGVQFAPANTKVIGPNTLEFLGITDTHWFPTSVVRAEDYAKSWYDFLPFVGSRPLPAIIESS